MATIDEILFDAEHRMLGALAATEEEFRHIRTGRANPLMLEGITVDYYGTQTPITQVGNVAVPEPRMLVITPWDKSLLGPISKAILNSDLSLNPSNDGANIRLVLPPLTEERRREYAKLAGKKAEEGKVAVRNVRRDAIEQLKKMEKAHEISEDESRRAQEKIQKLTDDYIKKIDAAHDKKVAEIMEV
ncbi:MAG TPA: ribosome recycling factor [Armatimonadota bacterium]|nr:ribosome recycling factor [Armatimonadota bacterium]HOS44101.1 ribosome recycling factor [Armatimonadota bacterium]